MVEGTAYLDMFDAHGHCLFERGFARWEVLHSAFDDFAAPGTRIESFATLSARDPGAAGLAVK